MRRFLLLGLAVLCINAAAPVTAPAQPITGAGGVNTVRDASALAARIRAYHRGPGSWVGSGPPPPGYCSTMSAGEFVLKQLVRLTNVAVSAGDTGLVLSLQQVANRLSDELDEEEAINLAAGFGYTEYPCPTAAARAARATVIRPIGQGASSCRRQADTRSISFNARRIFMSDCLGLGLY